MSYQVESHISNETWGSPDWFWSCWGVHLKYPTLPASGPPEEEKNNAFFLLVTFFLHIMVQNVH